jgi:pyruvate kinase
VLDKMIEAGVDVVRLNFSHADAEYFGPVIQKIRQVEKDTGIFLTVMGDLCGPKIRIGEVKGSPLQIRKGAYVCLGTPDMAAKAESDIFISLDVPELLDGLKEGMPVSLSDGMLQFKVLKVIESDRLVMMEALNGGILTSNKGIAFPGKTLKVAAMTDKDRRDLHQGLDIGIDAVALSFVQSREDIEDIKAEIARHGTWIPVVAKVERKNAVEKLDSILEGLVGDEEFDLHKDILVGKTLRLVEFVPLAGLHPHPRMRLVVAKRAQFDITNNHFRIPNLVARWFETLLRPS